MSDKEDSFDDGSWTGLDDWEEEAPDTVEDYYHGADDEGYWISEQHALELREVNSTDRVPPPLKDWNEVEPMVKIQVTMAEARRVLWQQGQEEIKLHRLNVGNLVGPGNTGQKKVYELLFGCKSKLCKLLIEELGLSMENFFVSYDIFQILLLPTECQFAPRSNGRLCIDGCARVQSNLGENFQAAKKAFWRIYLAASGVYC